MSFDNRSKFAALHRLWWRLHMNEKFSCGTKHPKQINKNNDVHNVTAVLRNLFLWTMSVFSEVTAIQNRHLLNKFTFQWNVEYWSTKIISNCNFWSLGFDYTCKMSSLEKTLLSSVIIFRFSSVVYLKILLFLPEMVLSHSFCTSTYLY